MATEILPQDSRNYWMLPQNPEESGYYTYGTPSKGAAQYCHPKLLNLIFLVESRWSIIDNRRFGIGNISMSGGPSFPPHHTHRSGLELDVRALRKDGKNQPVTYHDIAYDKDATTKLVNCFFETGLILGIFFNDRSIPRVKPMSGHDNHLHVAVIG